MTQTHHQDPLFISEERGPFDAVSVSFGWSFDAQSDYYTLTTIIAEGDESTPIEWSTRRLKWNQVDLIADLAEALRQVRRTHLMLKTF